MQINKKTKIFIIIGIFVCRCSTKLAASLARCRIKHNVLSIHCILPRSVRIKQGRSNCLPHYAWVNTMKSRSGEHVLTVETLLQNIVNGKKKKNSFDRCVKYLNLLYEPNWFHWNHRHMLTQLSKLLFLNLT